jgi:hypothetical protein
VVEAVIARLRASKIMLRYGRRTNEKAWCLDFQGTSTVPSSARGKCGFQQTSHKWPSGSAK